MSLSELNEQIDQINVLVTQRMSEIARLERTLAQREATIARLREALERIKRGPDDEDDRGGELMGIASAALQDT